MQKWHSVHSEIEWSESLKHRMNLFQDRGLLSSCTALFSASIDLLQQLQKRACKRLERPDRPLTNMCLRASQPNHVSGELNVVNAQCPLKQSSRMLMS